MTMRTLLAIIGLMALAGATGARAWTVDNSGNDASSNASRLSDPDEKSPLQSNKKGATYNFGGSKFSIHMSGPQMDGSSQRDEFFAPAGQGSIGPQFRSRPRPGFPGQTFPGQP